MTSLLKRVDNAVQAYIDTFVDGSVKGGTDVVNDLSTEGVGLATWGGFVDDIRSDIDMYRKQLVDGDVEVPVVRVLPLRETVGDLTPETAAGCAIMRRDGWAGRRRRTIGVAAANATTCAAHPRPEERARPCPHAQGSRPRDRRSVERGRAVRGRAPRHHQAFPRRRRQPRHRAAGPPGRGARDRR
jgi:hypothetical protein